MEEKLIPAILTVFGVILIIWLIPQLVKVWRISHDKGLEKLITQYAGKDKLWNVSLREKEGVDTKTIVACKIHSRPQPNKVVISVPQGDGIYRLGYAFEQETYELTLDNIKRIMPYEPAEAYNVWKL